MSLPQGDLAQRVRNAGIASLMQDLNAMARDAGVATGLGKPLCFVPQDELPQGIAYETFIAQTGAVPTRDNLHDRYNAMMWLTAPRTKALLNRLQHEEVLRLGGVQRRGAVRDALTLWDENLAVVVADGSADVVRQLLGAHDWQGLFLQHRPYWHSRWHVQLFGHALMEKLHSPYKAITAHAIVMDSPSHAWSALDPLLAQWLASQNQLTSKIFLPLPVMGIPGWCDDNADAGFYADAAVFRRKRIADDTRPR